jgi:hypothetical protein
MSFPAMQPSAEADVHNQFVIAPHHPDRLRRPAVAPSRAADERFRQAFLWNVFRTFELLTPAFWLRRLHARLLRDSNGAAPHIVRIRLWEPLPAPPGQCIDGARPDTLVDVVIETEHSVLTLMVADAGDAWGAADDRAARIVDAGSWFAGSRDHYFGVLDGSRTAPSVGALLKNRYERSSFSARLRSACPARAQLKGVGVIEPQDLAAILHDCAESDSLSDIERALAQHAVDWIARVAP